METLNVGDVFLSITPELCGNSPHFHIVVHKTDDQKVIVVYTTKEVEKTLDRCRRKERIKFSHIEPETCIIINSNHCDSLSPDFDSAVDCNNAKLKPISYFINKQYFKMCDPIIDSSIIQLIKRGIKLSNIVEDFIQKLI